MYDQYFCSSGSWSEVPLGALYNYVVSSIWQKNTSGPRLSKGDSLWDIILCTASLRLYFKGNYLHAHYIELRGLIS